MTNLARVRPSSGGSWEFFKFRITYCHAIRHAKYASKRGLRQRAEQTDMRGEGPFGPDCVRYLHTTRQLSGRPFRTLHSRFLRTHIFRRMLGIPPYMRPVTTVLNKLANTPNQKYL